MSQYVPNITCKAELAARATEVGEGPCVHGLLLGRHPDRHAWHAAGVWPAAERLCLLDTAAALDLQGQALRPAVRPVPRRERPQLSGVGRGGQILRRSLGGLLCAELNCRAVR